MTFKRYFFILSALLCSVFSVAQESKGFDPVRFEADLEQFVATEAALTPQESAAFFPLYREMRRKQLAFFGEDRRLSNVDTSDDKECAKAIRRRDENDLEIKRLQRTYHEKFMRVIPASKVFKVIRAEDRFHRRLFKRRTAGGCTRNGGQKHGK